MELTAIFGLQLTLSLAVFGLLAKWYLSPWLADKNLYSALGVLIAPHAFRHIGMSFLVPGLTSPTIPEGFASAAAYGDFISGLLALAAILALRYRWVFAVPLAWLFNIVGMADLIYALSHASAIPHLGASWVIPTFIVPVLLVTHFMVLTRLIKHAWSGLQVSEKKPFGKEAGATHAS